MESCKVEAACRFSASLRHSSLVGAVVSDHMNICIIASFMYMKAAGFPLCIGDSTIAILLFVVSPYLSEIPYQDHPFIRHTDFSVAELFEFDAASPKRDSVCLGRLVTSAYSNTEELFFLPARVKTSTRHPSKYFGFRNIQSLVELLGLCRSLSHSAYLCKLITCERRRVAVVLTSSAVSTFRLWRTKLPVPVGYKSLGIAPQKQG